MKLGKIIEQYRQENDLSQRQFAVRCGVSNGYIAILEKGVNRRTGKPISPTLPALEKIAFGMRVSLDELLRQMDDDDSVNIRDDSIPVDLTSEEVGLLTSFRALSPEGRAKVEVYIADISMAYRSGK